MTETSEDIATIAAKGLNDPKSLKPAEVKSVCASALRQFEPDRPEDVDASNAEACPICGVKAGEHKPGCTWTGRRG